jgi:hypothetical protein
MVAALLPEPCVPYRRSASCETGYQHKNNQSITHHHVIPLLCNLTYGTPYFRICQPYYSDIYIYGPSSSVCIGNDYGLDGPGIKSRCGRDFPYLSRPTQGPTQPPVQWVPRLSRE